MEPISELPNTSACVTALHVGAPLDVCDKNFFVLVAFADIFPIVFAEEPYNISPAAILFSPVPPYCTPMTFAFQVPTVIVPNSDIFD